MPHRPKPRAYDALDIWLGTQESAKEALGARTWSDRQQTHLRDFTGYDRINRSVDRLGHAHFRDKDSGRFVRGY